MPATRPNALCFDLLRHVNVARCEEVFHEIDDWSPTDWACALAGEAGEACNEVKKLRRLDGADRSADTRERRVALALAIGEELADTVIYADLLAARLGIDLGEAIRAKFNAVSYKRNSTVFLPPALRILRARRRRYERVAAPGEVRS